MSVLIKRMQMPEKCADCKFIMVSNTAYICGCTGYSLFEGVGNLDSHCPLIEIPEPTDQVIMISRDGLRELWARDTETGIEYSMQPIKAED